MPRPDAASPADAGSCADPEFSSLLSWQARGSITISQSGRRVYDGWTLVEQSWNRRLVLAIMPGESASDSGTLEARVASGHLDISSSRGELSSFALGSRLWLHVIDDPTPLWPPPKNGSELSVRDAPGGTLLLASMRGANGHDRMETEALTFRDPIERCRKSESCTNGEAIQYSVEAVAEPPQRLNPGERATITLGDIPYTLILSSAIRLTGTQSMCADHVRDDRLRIEASMRALEPQATLDKLSREMIPTCAPGNAPGTAIYAATYNALVADEISLEVTYRERSRGMLLFDHPSPPGQFALSEDALAEPLPGQTFWVDQSLGAIVLREREGGPLVVAGGSLTVANVERLSRWLALPLSSQPQCLYESYIDRQGTTHEASLFNASLDGTTVINGTTQRLVIQGLAYDVWLSRDLDLTITRAP